jgi:FkbM family methyltransferase
MNLSVDCGGETIDFQCFDNKLSMMVTTEILSGRTYPPVEAVTDVETVLDVGANVGAAALYLSIAYPQATVYAFEPAREPYALLQRNARDRPSIRPYNFGLFSSDRDVPLYRGVIDSVTASVGASEMNRKDCEIVTLRAVRGWLEENSIDRVDVLKIDTEGCEVPILRGMRHLVASRGEAGLRGVPQRGRSQGTRSAPRRHASLDRRTHPPRAPRRADVRRKVDPGGRGGRCEVRDQDGDLTADSSGVGNRHAFGLPLDRK